MAWFWPQGHTPFDLRSPSDGEVVGYCWPCSGSGKSKLAEIDIRHEALRQAGQDDGSTRQLYAAKIRLGTQLAARVFMSPKDRGTKRGHPGDFDITNNMTLPFFVAISAWVQPSKPQAVVCAARSQEKMVSRIGRGLSKSMPRRASGCLSGGNQQKGHDRALAARAVPRVAFGRALSRRRYRRSQGYRANYIRASSPKGRATLVFMAEIDEALEIADRIIVMNEGTDCRRTPINKNVDLVALVSDILRSSGSETGGRTHKSQRHA